MNLLDEQNLAGQTLVRLVARGQAIIAELLRLSTHIPPVFKMDDKATQKRYQDILLDFGYVGKADYHETKIEKDPVSRHLK
jgi:WASH complex subunit strumpellin